MSQRDSDIGIVCITHGLQAGRTRCRWCNFDPLKISRDCGEPASRQPHKLETDSSTLSIATNTSSGCNAGLRRILPLDVAVFSSGHVDDAANPITDMAG